MEYFKLVVSVMTSELMTFFNISSLGDLHRRFEKFIENISQRHNESVSLSMVYCLITRSWMMRFWTAAIVYLFEEIQIDLNVRLRDQHYVELGNLSLNIERRENKIYGTWPHWTVPSDCGFYHSQ